MSRRSSREENRLPELTDALGGTMGDGYESGVLESQGRLPPRRAERLESGRGEDAWAEPQPAPAAVMLERVNLHLEALHQTQGNPDVERHLAKTALRGLYNAISKDTGETIAAMKLHRKAQNEIKMLRERILLLERDKRVNSVKMDKSDELIEELRAKVKENETAVRRELRLAKENAVMREQIGELRATISAQVADGDARFRELLKRMEAMRERERYIKTHMYAVQAAVDAREKISRIAATGRGEIDSQEIIIYRVIVKTGDKKGAGTTAGVKISLIGDRDKTEDLILSNKVNNFQRGADDEFMLWLHPLGDIKRVIVKQDKQGAAPGWFLEKITVIDESTGTECELICERWLDENQDDGKVWRELRPGKNETDIVTYTVNVLTADKRGAGTDATVCMILYGANGNSGTQKLESGGDDFERGSADTFWFDCPDLGALTKVKLWHDNGGKAPGWFCDSVSVQGGSSVAPVAFPCFQWLDDAHGLEKTLEPGDGGPAEEQTYTVSVTTGDARGAGTDANVKINIFGTNADSGEQNLEGGAEDFERGNTDTFTLTLPDLGKITKVRITQDGTGLGSAWLLESVKIHDHQTQLDIDFVCSRWLNDKEGLWVDLQPGGEPPAKPLTYKIMTYTGGCRGAGTDANVFIELYGASGDPSPRLTLESGSNDFERGEINTFNVPCPAVGPLERVKIGHDNQGPGPGWFLDKVVVEGPDCPRIEFPCGRWLSESEDDHQIVRDLLRDGIDPRDALVKYEISVKTGDKRGCGTDANITLDITGSQGSTGDRPLESGQDDFERGQEDHFVIEAFDIGNITKIKLTSDNSGLGPAWLCDSVKIVNPKTAQQWTFNIQQWIDKKTGLSREFEAGAEPEQLSKYRVVTYTANTRGAGTDANVTINLMGEDNESGDLVLESGQDDFERDQSDEFILEIPDIGKLKSIRIGHDNSGPGPGWKLDHVLVENMLTSEQTDFPVYRWLAKDQEDQATSVTVSADPILGPDGLPMRFIVTWTVTVKTVDERGAGSDANVSIKLFGDRGNTENLRLESGANDFERGESNTFKIQTKDIGPLQKIRIGHDGKGFGSGWMMDSATIIDDGTGESWTFPCNRWFDEGQDDGLIVRELFPGEGAASADGKVIYEIEVVTGTVRGAGTDANVFLEMIGDKNDVGKTRLENSKDNFEKGKTDIFKIHGVDVGALQKIRIGHDNKGIFGSGWFLESVRIKKSGETYFFGCNRWLDKNEDDGSIVRELAQGDASALVKYHVLITTGSMRGAGTDANVSIVLYGAEGSNITNNSGERRLESKKDNFERGKTDSFVVECMDLGGVEKVRIGHDDAGRSSGWYLDNVTLWEGDDEDGKIVFKCDRWLAKDEDDGSIVRYLTKDSFTEVQYTTYLVTVYTGSVRGAGTDANVKINIYGDKMESGDTKLETKKDDFERGHVDEFRLKLPTLTSDGEDGTLRKIRIGHDGKGLGAGWFLDKVIIQDETVTGKAPRQWHFPAYRWLDEGEGDKQLAVDLFPSDVQELGKPNSYHITTVTGNRRGAGTGANVFVELVGANGIGDSGRLILESGRSNFERGKTDTFIVSCVSLGEISKIRIGHDAAGLGAGWFLDKVIVRDDATGKEYFFPAFRWLDTSPSEDNPNGHTTCELLPADADASDENASDFFRLEVTTGDRRGAGTDANVFVELVGSTASSGTKKLDAKRSDFERGNTDIFRVECSTVLGAITKLRVGHDNAGWSPAWFLDRVQVTNERTGDTCSFGCMQWFDKKEGDKQIIRELLPGDASPEQQLLDYKVLVKTGDVRSAGTSARVFMNIIGEHGESGDRPLDSGRSNFSRAGEDEFVIQAVALGEITKVRIGHDNKGLAPGWFLDNIEISQMESEEATSWKFPCGRWLSRSDDDKQIVRELLPLDSNASPGEGNTVGIVTYAVDVHTGDVRWAGTDANVYITLYGAGGNSGPRQLNNKWKNDFERGQVDQFTIEAADLGELEKVRIGHDGVGAGAGWFLDKVVVKHPDKGESTFPCGRWLDEKAEDGLTERELPKGEEGHSADIRAKTREGMVGYRLSIHTGDVYGAGTDANIKITLVGLLDGVTTSSGERVLKNGRNKFERNTWDEDVIEASDLGEITKIRIGHDDKGFMAGWFLDTIAVTNVVTSATYDFPCGRWFDRDEDDGLIERELVLGRGACVTYKVTTVTADVPHAGTGADVYIELIGELGSGGRQPLKKSGIFSSSFGKGSTDEFEISCSPLGTLQKAVIGHNGTGMGAGWNLKEVTVLDHDENTFVFENKENDGWLDAKEGDKKIERRLVERNHQSTGSLKLGKETTYVVTVCTGTLSHAGTNANVFVTVYGEHGDTGERKLPSKRGHFEKGQEDVFRISAVELGTLEKLRIRHDSKGLGAGWFLDRVDVRSEASGKGWSFPCNRWLDKTEDDGRISRDLVAEEKPM